MAELKIDINGPEGLKALQDIRRELAETIEANNKGAKEYIEAARRMKAENEQINKTLVDTHKRLQEKQDQIVKLEKALQKYQQASTAANNAVNESLSETEQLLAQIKEWADKGLFNADEVRVMTDLINDQGDAADNLAKVYEIVYNKLSELGDPTLLQELENSVQDVINESGLLERAVDSVADSFSQLDGKQIFSPEELIELRDAINETTTEAEALSVIHDALIDKQKEFAEGSAEWNNYASMIKDVEDAVSALNGETEANIVAQQNLTQQLKDVKEEMQALAASGDTTSEAYRELEQQAGDLQRAISVVNKDIKNAGSATPGLNKVIGVLKEVTAGFGLVQSAQALFGQESEGTQQALLKVTAALTLLNSLQEIQTALLAKDSLARGIHTAVTKAYTWAQNAATASVHAFRAALVATGIGAFVVLIGTAISYLMDFSDATDEAARANDRLKEALDRVDKALNRNSTNIRRATEERIAQAKLAGASERELHEIRQQGYDEEIANLKRAEQEYDKQLANRDLTVEQYNEIQDKRNKAIDEQESLYHQKRMDRYDVELKEMESSDKKHSQSFGNRQKLRDRELENIKKFNADYAKLLNQYANLSIEMIVDKYEREEAIARKSYEDQLADLEQHHAEIMNNQYISEEERALLEEKFIEAKAGLEVKYTREKVERAKAEQERIYQIQSRAQIAQFELQQDNLAMELVQLDAHFRELQNIYEEAGKDTEELEEAKWKATTELMAKYSQQELDMRLETAKKSIDILNVQGLNEEKATRLKNNMRLAAEQEYARESLKIMEQTTGQVLDFSEEQIEALRDHIRKSVDRGEAPIDPLAFLGIDADGLTDEQRQELYGYVETLVKEADSAVKRVMDDFSFGGIIARFFDWEGEDREKAINALNDAASLTVDAYHQMMDAMARMVQNEIDLIDKKLEKYEEQVSAQESMVDKEKELMEQGYANNYALEQKRLEDLKAREQEMLDAKKKAQEELQRIQKQQMIADYATSSASMVVAVANTIKSLSDIPIVGWVLGLAAAGSLIAGFVNLQAQIKSLNSSPSFEKGGVFDLLSGQPSHAEGGVGLYNEKSGRKLAEFEGDERLFIMNKGSSGKYEDLLWSINNDDRASILSYLDKLGGSTFSVNDKAIDTFNKDAAYIVKVESESKVRTLNYQSSEMKDLARTNREMLEIEKRRKMSGTVGDFDIWETEKGKRRHKKRKD